MAKHFAARLKIANLAIKADINDFVERTDFDDKLKKLNEKFTSSKAKYALVKNELNEHIKRFYKR